jgi:hypothetical protein
MVRTARDRTLIKAREPSEVRYWATTLRCAEVGLIAAGVQSGRTLTMSVGSSRPPVVADLTSGGQRA